MSKFQKALVRLRSRPRRKDFSWKELQTTMLHIGYEEVKGGGSRQKFIYSKSGVTISLHEPHPSPIVKMYALDIVIEHLKQENLL